MNRRVRFLGLLGFALISCGCSQIDSSTDTPNINKSLSLLVPEYTELSRVRIPGDGRRFVSLGDTEEKAAAVFARPSRGFDFPEPAIPGFPADFKAKGWESNSKGFGVILHDDKIVLAMEQIEAVEADEFAGLLENVKTINGLDHFQKITQDKAEFWFAKMGQDILSISRVAGLKKRYQVTITIGNQHVMDALGILKDVKKDDFLPNTEKHAL